VNEESVRAILRDLRRFGGDTTLVECKKAAGGVPDNLASTICAFANMPSKGLILLGIDERSNFAVTGVDDPAKMMQAVADQTRGAVEPAPPLEFSDLKLDGKAVVAVQITPLSPLEKPARYRGEAYLRYADGDYVVNANELRMIQVEALHSQERVSYDQGTVEGTSVVDLDHDLLADLLKSARNSSRRLKQVDNDEQVLRLIGVINDGGDLTLAGLYALGYFPQGRQPALAATAAVRVPRDDSGVRNRNLTHFDGPLPVMLEDIVEWVRQNTSSERVYQASGHMVNRPEFPPSAIRELVANALVHRDLGPDTVGLGKRVEVRVTDDELIVTSPGGLRGVSQRQLESPNELHRVPVNQRLYEIVKLVQTSEGNPVIEGEGGGLREVFAATRDADLPRPRLIDTGVQFTVKLSRLPYFSPEDERWLKEQTAESLTHMQKAVLVGLRDGESWSLSRMIREFSPLTLTEARAQIEDLQEHLPLEVTEDGAVELESPGPVDDNVGPDLRSLGKNVPLIASFLQSVAEASINEIVQNVNLSVGQVHYGLRPLREHGFVEMVGAQGAKTTTYRWRRPT